MSLKCNNDNLSMSGPIFHDYKYNRSCQCNLYRGNPLCTFLRVRQYMF